MTAQFSQALGSLLLSVAALRTLEAAAFGVLALLLGSLVLATALMTGFVGDTLTVHDRAEDRVRAGLQAWTVVIAGGLVVIGGVSTWCAHLLTVQQAVLFALALGTFVLEEVARRLLMATLRFWSLVIVDLSYLVTAALVMVAALRGRGHLVLSDFLVALLLGQLAATALAVVLLPSGERRLAPWDTSTMGTVAQFGGWRAFQQAIRPAALTLVRMIVLSTAGSSALGGLEAARVYMSPALLVVQGTGGFLLAAYALDRQSCARDAVRGADRATARLLGLTAALGIGAVVAAPWAAPVLTGRSAGLSAVAVTGWAVYAASVAATMPYASLAAVRGRQAAVVARRLVDTVLALVLVVLLVSFMPDPVPRVPLVLALAGFLGAVLQRSLCSSSGREGHGSVGAAGSANAGRPTHGA